jgi:hypothetical protein
MGNLQSLESQCGENGTLSKAEMDRLERRLRKQGRGRAEVARSDLRAIDGLSQNPFVERIFQMFDSGMAEYIIKKPFIYDFYDDTSF